MPKTKNKPGIHLLKSIVLKRQKKAKGKPVEYKKMTAYYWHIVARNGRIIARSSETYSRKSGAVNSIKVAAEIFRYDHPASYYDHSKPNSPLQSYL